jgi:Tfp pilus assembly protein PilF
LLSLAGRSKGLRYLTKRVEGTMHLRSSRFSTWLFVGVLSLSLTSAAQRGSGTSNSNRNLPSARPGTTTNTDPTTVGTFVTGKVMLEGGGPVREPVAIERVCNTVVRREGYSDSKGQFEFQLGSNVTFQDASEDGTRAGINTAARTGNPGRKATDLNSCELRAVLAGYQSTIVMLRATAADSWQYDVGTIFIKPLGNAPGSTISVTSMAAPKKAMSEYEKGQRIKIDSPLEAIEHLKKAVGIYPRFAAAWAVLGDIDRQREEFVAARSEYAKAIAADPQFINPIYGLAVISMREKKWEEAVKLSDEVIKLNASAFPVAYLFNAAANYNLQRFDAAGESARTFKALDTGHSHPDVCLLLKYVFSIKQDYASAAREIHDYLAILPNAPDAESLKKEAKRFEDLSVSASKRQ